MTSKLTSSTPSAEAIIAELREENEMLRSKTDNLTEEVENLREKVKELSTTRKIQNTPFECTWGQERCVLK